MKQPPFHVLHKQKYTENSPTAYKPNYVFPGKDNYGKLNCNILFIAPKTLYNSVCELLINFLIALVIIPIFILLLHVLIFMIPVCELDHLRKLYVCHVLPVTVTFNSQ